MKESGRGMQEANFDSIVGLTHNYAGMSPGNVASTRHAGTPSRPQDAALQGLAKMKAMAKMGVLQGWFPPHHRPDIALLRQHGISGSDDEVICAAAAADPALLARASSSSFMWAANAATVAPSLDTRDRRVHFVVANLHTMSHRRIEPPQTQRMLRHVFPDVHRFHVHPPVAGEGLTDEGAANHTRLAADGERSGVHLFVYGAGDESSVLPQRYPARQTAQASRDVARLLDLPMEQIILAQQHPDAIDAGVFHNDVIAVGNGAVLLYHEGAFLHESTVIDALQRGLDGALIPIRITNEEVSIADAVTSYLFNSQLVTLPDQSMALISPQQCDQFPAVTAAIDAIIADSGNPITAVHTFHLGESMANGGGPACLRLRVGLGEEEIAAVHPPCLYTDDGYERLVDWVHRWYPQELLPEDLADPQLLIRSKDALQELTTILNLGTLYEFQQ